MRAINEFGLVSAWSDGVSLNVTAVETTSGTTNTEGGHGGRGLPVYGSVLIGLVLVLVGGFAAAVAVMCVVVHYRRHMINKSVSGSQGVIDVLAIR